MLKGWGWMKWPWLIADEVQGLGMVTFTDNKNDNVSIKNTKERRKKIIKALRSKWKTQLGQPTIVEGASEVNKKNIYSGVRLSRVST
jgi:hypothetical protein